MSTTSLISVPAGGAKIVPGRARRRTTRSSRSSRATASASTSRPVMQAVVDAAVEKAYGGERADPLDGDLRRREVDPALRRRRLAARGDARGAARVLVSIKGPMTTPVGGGIRSLNVALRQELDLYVCLRPVRYFRGVPSPLKDPSQDRHGHLPREHRGHLRRHRVGGRVGGRAQGDRVPPGRDGRAEDPLPGDVGHRDQAGLARGHRAARAAGDPVRDRQRPPLGDARAQGQHHEVHRGRASATGATRSPRASSAPSRSTAARG